MHLVRMNEVGIGVKPLVKHGTWHAMGSATLADVTFTGDGIRGQLLDEWTEERPPASQLASLMREVHWTGERFVTKQGKKFVSVMGKSFKAVYVCGHKVYVR